ncbi:hypothetical protein DZC30_05060 [Comamonas testosteroni]|uniref:BRCT domain-containing protein n=1 Tax=Comamonas testosteroni TaxID=285 RepID=A0A373FPT5_COMTE|nr:hypothetical protein DZC30_05060 [Comamonas testosteroni]
MFQFSYSDNFGAASVRTVNVTGVTKKGRQEYLEGFCQLRMDVRTFRTDRIRGDLVDVGTGELVSVKRLLSTVRERKVMAFQPSAPSTPASTRKNWQTAVVFTGFSEAAREELEDLAEVAGWDVRSTVGSTLDYLVTGPRAGPSKVAKAEELGVTVIDEDVFRALV